MYSLTKAAGDEPTEREKKRFKSFDFRISVLSVSVRDVSRCSRATLITSRRTFSTAPGRPTAAWYRPAAPTGMSTCGKSRLGGIIFFFPKKQCSRIGTFWLPGSGSGSAKYQPKSAKNLLFALNTQISTVN